MKIQQRKALVKIALLAFGWPLALNHFCDRNLAGGIGAFLLTWLAWISIVGLVFWVPIFFEQYSRSCAILKAITTEHGSPQLQRVRLRVL